MQTELRAHHLVNLFFCFGQAEEREERIEQQLEAFVAWRGPEIMEPSRKLLLQIANHPNLRIKIILGGKDGFCEGCSKLEECQYGKGADWVDKETIEVLGIEEGNDYSLEEIIKKAKLSPYTVKNPQATGVIKKPNPIVDSRMPE